MIICGALEDLKVFIFDCEKFPSFTVGNFFLRIKRKMFMPFIHDLWLNIYKNKLKIVLNVHCKLWADNSFLYDTAIYAGEYHKHLFQNPAN